MDGCIVGGIQGCLDERLYVSSMGGRNWPVKGRRTLKGYSITDHVDLKSTN